MSFKIPVKYTILGIIAFLVGIFLLGWCLSAKHTKSVLNPTINALNAELTRTVVKLNNVNLYVTSVEQELETIKQAKANGDVTNKELRKLNLSQANE